MYAAPIVSTQKYSKLDLMSSVSSRYRVGKSSKLTEKQVRAVGLMSEGVSYREIAKQLGVTTRTVERWAMRPDLRQAVEQAKAKALETVEEAVSEKYKRAIESMIPAALTILHKTLKSSEAKDSDKLRAVQILGKWYGLEKSPVFVKAENQTDPEVLLKQYLGAIRGNGNGATPSNNN